MSWLRHEQDWREELTRRGADQREGDAPRTPVRRGHTALSVQYRVPRSRAGQGAAPPPAGSAAGPGAHVSISAEEIWTQVRNLPQVTSGKNGVQVQTLMA